VHWGPGSMRGEFSRYNGPGPREPRRGPLISEGPLNLTQTHIFFFFFFFFSTQFLNFERSLSLSPEPQSSLVPPCKISLGSPAGAPIYTTTHRNKNVNVDKIKHIYCIEYFQQNQCLNIKKKTCVARLWSLPWQEKSSHKNKIFLTWKIVLFSLKTEGSDYWFCTFRTMFFTSIKRDDMQYFFSKK